MSLLINHSYRFGKFALDTDQRVLLRDGRPLSVTPKVFETLLILVENSGRIVDKEDLMRRLWPDTFVEEANLTFNIQQVRKVLGDDARRPRYIETIPRRGYRFIAEVEAVLTDPSAVNELITHRFQTYDAKPPEAAIHKSETTTQESPPVAGLRSAERAPLPEKRPPVPAAGSTRASKRRVALAAALAIVFAGAAFTLWKVSNDSNASSRENHKADVKSLATLPLKLEELSGTGQSRQVAISPDGKYVAYTRMLEAGRPGAFYFARQHSVGFRDIDSRTDLSIPLRTTHY